VAYIGRENDGFGVRSRFIYTATGGQTTFNTDDSGNALSYADGAYVDVYLNGVLLDPADYTDTSLTSIVLASGATASDILEVIVYDVFSVFSGTFTNGITTSDATVTGDLTISDKIVHSGDTNTNVRFPAADTVAIETAGSERMRVDSTGVGIGTTSPVRQLHVNAASGSNAYLHLTNATTGTTTGDGLSILVTNSNGQAIINQREAQPLSFYTSGSERVRVLAGGGLTFNGDTADANALDDYEEGTWTPGITGMTFSSSAGVYTKIGKRVQCSGIISDCTSGTASAVAAKISGLPYTVADSLSGTSLEDGGIMHYWTNFGLDTSVISIAPGNNSTECFMYRVAGSGGTTVTSVLRTGVDASNFACRVSFTYIST